MDEVASLRLSTTAAHVQCQVRSCGIRDGRSGTEEGFFCVPQFPLPILIPLIAPHSLIILSQTLYSVDTDSVVK
jgi:hypothetical protein